jgi:hypothetical protein
MSKVVRIGALTRRDFGHVLGLGTIGLACSPAIARGQEFGILKTPDASQKRINALWRYVGSVYYFEPFGLYVEPGETVDFYNAVSSGRAPTITAYHPDSGNRELRIPERANRSTRARGWQRRDEPSRDFESPSTSKAPTTISADMKNGPAWSAASSWGNPAVRVNAPGATATSMAGESSRRR